MLAVDVCLLVISLFLAYYLRFDGDIPSNEVVRFLQARNMGCAGKDPFFFSISASTKACGATPAFRI